MKDHGLRRPASGLVALLALSAMIIGPGIAVAQDASPSPAASPGASPAAMVIAATGVTASQAVELALTEVPGGAVVDIDQGWERGLSYWDAVVLTEDGAAVEVYVDASDGTVIRQAPTRTPVLALAGAPAVSARQALDAALGAAPGGSVIEADLDVEDGTLIWEVLVRTDGGRVEVYVDAATGDVIKVEDA